MKHLLHYQVLGWMHGCMEVNFFLETALFAKLFLTKFSIKTLAYGKARKILF
jgi:hypothetical protein